MKKLLLVTMLTLCSINLHSMIGGYAADTTLTTEQVAKTNTQRAQIGQAAIGTNTQSSNCTQCQVCDTEVTIPMPPLVVSMANAAGTTINTCTINTPTNFLVANAILIVHIFPPSNTISTSGVTLLNPSASSYAVMYTLKSLDGNNLYKQLQTVTAATSTSAAVPPVMIKSEVAQIPTSITISANITLAATTAQPNPTPTATPTLGPITFLPNMTGVAASSKQQVFNSISPLSQKFLISWDPTTNSATATAMSGMFDTEDGTTLASAFVNSNNTKISPTSGAAMPAINIALSGSPISSSSTPKYSCVFSQSDLPLNGVDAQNGVMLNIHVFPPSTGGSNYIVIATLRTLDGLKLHKKIQTVQFSNAPAYLQVTCATTTLAEIVLPASAQPQITNLLCPMNLRCLLQANTAEILTLSML